MKTNNLMLLLFCILFCIFGFIFWWVRNKSAQYVSDTASKTISDARQNFSVKDIVLSGGKLGIDALFNRLDNKTNSVR